MRNIVPAIIGQNFAEVQAKINLVEGLTEWVQLDIMDGLFAPTYSWQTPDDLAGLEGKAKIEIHLMSEAPELVVPDWINVVDRIIFHLEATDKVEEIFNYFLASPVKLGVALKLETEIEMVVPYLPRLDLVQLMSIKQIGAHGQPFENEVLEKIKDLRARWSGGTISIDGGINLESAKLCFDAGADQVAVGSALWDSPDVKATMVMFQSL